jgi:hypothetical protein
MQSLSSELGTKLAREGGHAVYVHAAEAASVPPASTR